VGTLAALTRTACVPSAYADQKARDGEYHAISSTDHE
jgi:hypothetical protein